MKYLWTLLAVVGLVLLVFAYRGVQNMSFTRFNLVEYVEEDTDLNETLFSSGKEGDGKLLDETREVADFTKIAVSNAIRVELQKGDACKVVVRTDSNLQEHIKVIVEEGKLRIYVKGAVRKFKKMLVTVTFKTLESVEASSAARISYAGEMTTSNLYLKANSLSRIYLKNITADTLEANLSSTGRIRVGGSAGTFTVKASSASRGYFDDLKADTVNLRASSAALVKVWAIKKLDAKASSAARVRYRGEVKEINLSNSSGGSIRRR